MLTRIYLAVLGVGCLVTGFLTYYSWTWTQSIGRPADAIAGYESNRILAWSFLWISSIVLLLLANGILWSTKRVWAMWTTFTYFTVFVLVSYWGLQVFQMLTQPAGAGTFSVVAIMLIVLAAAIVFFDQFIVIKLREKTYGTPALDAAAAPADDRPE